MLTQWLELSREFALAIMLLLRHLTFTHSDPDIPQPLQNRSLTVTLTYPSHCKTVHNLLLCDVCLFSFWLRR